MKLSPWIAWGAAGWIWLGISWLANDGGMRGVLAIISGGMALACSWRERGEGR